MFPLNWFRDFGGLRDPKLIIPETEFYKKLAVHNLTNPIPNLSVCLSPQAADTVHSSHMGAWVTERMISCRGD